MEIKLEGATVICEDQTICALDSLKPGELYIANRNTGWKLLTCAEVKYATCEGMHGEYPCNNLNKKHPDFIVSKEFEYSYNAWEAYKVLEIK